MQNFKQQKVFELSWIEKSQLFFYLYLALSFIFVSIYGLSYLLKNLSTSEILFYIFVIFFQILFAYVIKRIIEIIRYEYKSVVIDSAASKLVVKSKKSCFVEIPFEAIDYIGVPEKRFAIRLSLADFIFIDIHTSNNENYRIAVTSRTTTEFCKLLPKDIKIKKL